MSQFNRTREFSTTPTITNGTYTINDVIGGLLSFQVFSAGKGGVIRAIRILDEAANAKSLRVYFFNEAPASIANDAAFNLSADDLRKAICAVDIDGADWFTDNGVSQVFKDVPAGEFELKGPPDSTNLWAYIIDKGAFAFTGTDQLTVDVVVWPD